MTRDDAVRIGLLTLAALACVHLAALGAWVVDDAAIAWAFSRNWAEGHGLVPYVGGERVEGYSDFLWMALIALGERAGVDAWAGAKGLAAALTVGTVPLVYRLAAAATPRAPVVAGLAAAAVFAADTQVAIFGASGLENPLFTFLLALGLWRAAEETRLQSTPWSALAFLGIALTRPEGVAYAAVAGFAALLGAPRDRRGAARIATWLALFWVPFLGYHAVRWWYFAWPFPMTFYAKVKEERFGMTDARSQGWGYVVGYVLELGRGPMLPLLALGRTGLDRRGLPWLGAALLAGAIGAFVPLPPGAFALLWLAVLLGLWVPGLGAAGPAGIAASCWAMGTTSALFALYAQGDWMGAYRWLSFAAAPFAVLLGSGLGHLSAALDARAKHLGAALAALALVPIAAVNVRHTRTFAENPDFSPFSVRNRLVDATAQWRRFHVDDRPRLLTIDMGGFMWFSDWELNDLVGLVDVTFAQQGHRRRLLWEDWVARVRRPHLVFVSDQEAQWVRKRRGLDADYLHVGPQEEIRRDLLFADAWTGPGPAVDLGEVVVHGLSAPGGPVSDAIYVELGLSTPTRDPFAVQLVLGDADGARRATWQVPLAAGLVPPERWRPEDVSIGRYHFALPPDLPRGLWRLGARVWTDGAVARPAALPAGVTQDEAGVLWWGTTVEVTTRDEADARAAAAVAALPADCAEAERAWFLARRTHADPRPFDAAHGAGARATLASCWAAAAATDPDPVDRLERARELDPAAPGVAAALTARADALQGACDAHHAAAAWAACAAACDDALRLDPTRSWTRKTAERCRDAAYDEEEQRRKRRPTPPEE